MELLSFRFLFPLFCARGRSERAQKDSQRNPPKDFIPSPSSPGCRYTRKGDDTSRAGEEPDAGVTGADGGWGGSNERKGVPVEISRRKLSAAIVQHRLSVRRGRKMRYEMKRRAGGVGGGPPRVKRDKGDDEGRQERRGGGDERDRGSRWNTRVKEAHIKRATSTTWKAATGGIASSSPRRDYR